MTSLTDHIAYIQKQVGWGETGENYLLWEAIELLAKQMQMLHPELARGLVTEGEEP